MPFVIKRTDTYPFTVDVTPPGDDNPPTQQLAATFKYLTVKELDELQELTVPEQLNRVFVGASNLSDEAGNSVTFSDDLKAQLLQDPRIFRALHRGFWASVYGVAVKN